jgi:hypothetical protein
VGKVPRSLSVGRLEFEPVPLEARKWGVIGCAPGVDPHWLLYHYEHAAARLVLLFDDDGHAKSYVGKTIDSTTSRVGSEQGTRLPPLRRFMRRQVQDLYVAPSLSVARVAATPELLNWMNDVVHNDLDDLPQEFAETTHDVIFLPRLNGSPSDRDVQMDDAFRAGRFALLRDSLCGSNIAYKNPRVFKL